MSLRQNFTDAISPLTALAKPLWNWTFSTRGLQIKFALGGSALCFAGSIGVGIAVGRPSDDLMQQEQVKACLSAPTHDAPQTARDNCQKIKPGFFRPV
ncbi:MAG: hypothetical protein JWO78_935 [Micavibrio sp.]|nr:hypothetical protein [Micavibrio sp.]